MVLCYCTLVDTIYNYYELPSMHDDISKINTCPTQHVKWLAISGHNYYVVDM